MQTPTESHSIKLTETPFPRVTGAALVLIGAAAFLDRYLHTGWLRLLYLPGIGAPFLLWGYYARRFGPLVPGCLIAGLGLGGMLSLGPYSDAGVAVQAGLLLVGFGLGWAAMAVMSNWGVHRSAWWALIPAGVIVSLSAPFLFSSLRLVDFALYVLTGVALTFLAWGTLTRKIGLIIPGSVMIGIGPGVYLAWRGVGEVQINALAQTGVMLVYFSMGWGLITIFSKLVNDRFTWWPLIPGGVLAVTGYGLYLGGDPHNALSFISDTGSVGLILFGLYLLLWRWGLKD
jgi:hypothetical protein